MALMCEECKCTIYPGEGCDNGCPCCNDPDYISAEDMLTNLIEYIKLHKLSLEQDIEKLNKDRSVIWSDGNDIEEVSLNGQIIALSHILNYIDNASYEGV